MRIAAIYDIHGNLGALEAVLTDIEREKVDLVLVGGDLAWGPFPRETINLLRRLENATFIRGNADREVAQRLGREDGLDEVTADVNRWAADRLSGDQMDWLARLQPMFVGEVDEIGDVHFCHGSPRSDEEVITPLTTGSRLRSALVGVKELTVVCGHTHMQFRREEGNHHIVNAGSVGMPYQGEQGAFWALLGPDLELRKTTYDVERAVAAMKASECPHVEEVFIDTLLHPPEMDETARHFEKFALEHDRS